MTELTPSGHCDDSASLRYLQQRTVRGSAASRCRERLDCTSRTSDVDTEKIVWQDQGVNHENNFYTSTDVDRLGLALSQEHTPSEVMLALPASTMDAFYAALPTNGLRIGIPIALSWYTPRNIGCRSPRLNSPYRDPRLKSSDSSWTKSENLSFFVVLRADSHAKATPPVVGYSRVNVDDWSNQEPRRPSMMCATNMVPAPHELAHRASTGELCLLGVSPALNCGAEVLSNLQPGRRPAVLNYGGKQDA
ncbi:hypothetical protein M8818_002396 [Zalaria obscura]|uniref:Uncharacterized protein n=1 Tax=Zalaria obscura TaxID=2024903 RepID=A0ACC3SIA1_9PEZI